MDRVWQRVLVAIVLLFVFYLLFGAKKTLELLLNLDQFYYCEEEYECI
jgi:hypothetical protein